jgi:hypothetical protein
MKKYRFFYHYYKQKNCMTVHFKKKCIIANNIKCETPCETKWNKTQPMLVMQGWATNVLLKEENDIITAIIK